MSMQQQETESWEDKLKRYALIVIPIVVAIWLFNIASNARATAQTNAEAVQVPRFELALVPGGPERFAETFQEAVDELGEEEELDATQYLWSTYVVRNIGERDAADLTFDVTAAIPIDRLLIAPPGFGNDASIEHEEGSNQATVDLEELDEGDQVLLFVGMSPQNLMQSYTSAEAIRQPYDKEAKRIWARDFELYFETLTVDSDQAEGTLYSDGYAALYSQEES